MWNLFKFARGGITHPTIHEVMHWHQQVSRSHACIHTHRNIHIYVYTHTLTQFFTSLVDSTFSLLCSFPPALCLSFSLCLWMVSGPSLHPATVEQIVSVFQAASKQKAWDHFSKAQRKNLDMWRKQAEVSIL